MATFDELHESVPGCANLPGSCRARATSSRTFRPRCTAARTRGKIELAIKAELEALGKAKAILLKKFAFLQTTAKVHAISMVQATIDGDSKTHALRSIKQVGRKLHNAALVSLAYRAASDPVGKFWSRIEDMIAKLPQEAAEEAEGAALEVCRFFVM